MVSYGHKFLKPTKVFGSWLGPMSAYMIGDLVILPCVHSCFVYLTRLAQAKGKNTEKET